MDKINRHKQFKCNLIFYEAHGMHIFWADPRICTYSNYFIIFTTHTVTRFAVLLDLHLYITWYIFTFDFELAFFLSITTLDLLFL